MRLKLLLILIGSLALLPLTMPAQAHAAEPPSRRTEDFWVLGHRGAPTPGTTENTLEALRRADRAGAQGSEFDVRLTVDRHIVLMHDRSLRRTTNCRARVDRSRYRWLRRNCRGRNRERVPSVAAALGWARRHRQRVVIEVKDGHRWRTDDLASLVNQMQQARMLRHSTVLCFSLPTLQRIERAHPLVTTGWIATSWAGLARARTRGIDVMHVPAAALTRRRVAGLHDDGMRVIGRVTNDPREWRRLRSIGADGVVTDRPHAATRHLRSR